MNAIPIQEPLLPPVTQGAPLVTQGVPMPQLPQPLPPDHIIISQDMVVINIKQLRQLQINIIRDSFDLQYHSTGSTFLDLYTPQYVNFNITKGPKGSKRLKIIPDGLYRISTEPLTFTQLSLACSLESTPTDYKMVVEPTIVSIVKYLIR